MGRKKSLEDIAEALQAHTIEDGQNHQTLTVAVAEVKNSVDRVQELIDGLKKAGLKLGLWVIALMVTATVSSMIQQRIQHHEVVDTAKVAAVEASKSAVQGQVIVNELSNVTEPVK